MCDAGTRERSRLGRPKYGDAAGLRKLRRKAVSHPAVESNKEAKGLYSEYQQFLYSRIVFKSLKYNIIFQHFNREGNMVLSVIYQDLK